MPYAIMLIKKRSKFCNYETLETGKKQFDIFPIRRKKTLLEWLEIVFFYLNLPPKTHSFLPLLIETGKDNQFY